MVPKIQLALVDVRDVARAHVAAMTSVASNGHRILITAQPSFWFKDIARVLIKEFRRQGSYKFSPLKRMFIFLALSYIMIIFAIL